MATKLSEIFADVTKSLENLSNNIDKESSSYQFEVKLTEILRNLGQWVFQTLVGEIPKSKNDRITILTNLGDICFHKSHSLATSPDGFKISPYMQEHLCKAGTRLTFEEASEQVTELKGVAENAKQIER